jgi:hypothetical protein
MDRLERVDIEPINILADRLARLFPAPPKDSPERGGFDRRDPKYLSRILPSPPVASGEFDAQAARALKTWRMLEKTFLAIIDLERDGFLSLFRQVHASRSAGTQAWTSLVGDYGYLCDGAIPGVEWVDAFAWRLPSAEPSHSDDAHEAAYMMAAILYFDTLHRHGSEAIDDEEAGEILAALDGLLKICA